MQKYCGLPSDDFMCAGCHHAGKPDAKNNWLQWVFLLDSVQQPVALELHEELFLASGYCCTNITTYLYIFKAAKLQLNALFILKWTSFYYYYCHPLSGQSRGEGKGGDNSIWGTVQPFSTCFSNVQKQQPQSVLSLINLLDYVSCFLHLTDAILSADVNKLAMLCKVFTSFYRCKALINQPHGVWTLNVHLQPINFWKEKNI